jgi:hypothetical protein
VDVRTGVRIRVNYQFAFVTSNRGRAALTNVSNRDRITAGAETLRQFFFAPFDSVDLDARELA